MKIPDCFIVVDDDPTNNMLCGFILRRIFPDSDVKLFTEPEEALEAIKMMDRDKIMSTVLFLDINMPSMTGWEFMDIFETFTDQIHNNFTIYILSSSVEERDIEKADSHPLVSGFLSKPLQVESINHIFNDDILLNKFP